MSALAYIIYFLIVIAAFIKVSIYFELRQLVKANFWVNIAIFALLALLTLVVLNEFYLNND